jgi:hypothetical protein
VAVLFEEQMDVLVVDANLGLVLEVVGHSRESCDTVSVPHVQLAGMPVTIVGQFLDVLSGVIYRTFQQTDVV